MNFFDLTERRIARARYLLEAAGWDKLDERAEAIARTPFDVDLMVRTLTCLRDANAPPLSEQLERMRQLLEENRFS